jgi:hypothetical protein
VKGGQLMQAQAGRRVHIGDHLLAIHGGLCPCPVHFFTDRSQRAEAVLIASYAIATLSVMHAIGHRLAVSDMTQSGIASMFRRHGSVPSALTFLKAKIAKYHSELARKLNVDVANVLVNVPYVTRDSRWTATFRSRSGPTTTSSARSMRPASTFLPRRRAAGGASASRRTRRPGRVGRGEEDEGMRKACA